MDRDRAREWFYALMDYGTMLGRSAGNANTRSLRYRRQKPFEGSLRKLRGEILAAMLVLKKASAAQLAKALATDDPRVETAVRQLLDEGFLTRTGKLYCFR